MQIKSIGDRMEQYYEDRYCFYLTRKVPVIIRLDGRAFHALTADLNKPFDQEFMFVMEHAAVATSEEMQGFKFGYVQSDEASFLLTDFDNVNTEAWFDYNLNKVVSISASLMSAYFDFFVTKYRCSKVKSTKESVSVVFDSRAFNIPREDVANYFIWRYQDCQRNSLHAYCRRFFSQERLMGKSKGEQHEMLYSIGKNWATDLTSREKNGIFIFKGMQDSNDACLKAKNEITSEFCPTYDSINGRLGYKL